MSTLLYFVNIAQPLLFKRFSSLVEASLIESFQIGFEYYKENHIKVPCPKSLLHSSALLYYSNLRNKRRGTAILSSAIFHPLLTYLRPLRLFFLKLFTKNPFFMSTSGRILADFHPIRTYFGFFNPLRLFIFENGAASTFIRPSTFIPEVRVGRF